MPSLITEDEPSQRRATPLWHDQPLEEARGRAECRERDRVFVDHYLVDRRDEIKERKHPSAAQLVEDFIDAGYGELTENADVVQLLIDRKPNPAEFLWYDHNMARVR